MTSVANVLPPWLIYRGEKTYFWHPRGQQGCSQHAGMKVAMILLNLPLTYDRLARGGLPCRQYLHSYTHMTNFVPPKIYNPSIVLFDNRRSLWVDSQSTQDIITFTFCPSHTLFNKQLHSPTAKREGSYMPCMKSVCLQWAYHI